MGTFGSIGWFYNQTSISRSLSAISVLGSEFITPAYGETVIAIELVNEPFPDTPDEIGTLEGFYRDGYNEVRKFGGEGGERQQAPPTVLLSEAYQSLGFWSGFMPAGQYNKVALDVHIYGMRVPLEVEVRGWHLSYPNFPSRSRFSNKLVGEFTTAHTDCEHAFPTDTYIGSDAYCDLGAGARWLNGRDRGARFDNTLNPDDPNADHYHHVRPQITADCRGKTGAAADFGADYINFLAQSFEAQTWLYEQASGWVFWTWKTESAAGWDFRMGVTYGWIPQPLWAKPHGPVLGRAVLMSSDIDHPLQNPLYGHVTRGEQESTIQDFKQLC
ncbi:hypothetical protein QFC21_005259 [Naganishia friedmannii]|uniref:Uncharacterized protein n=1 Tax=Naganishia friedmannii TaxID=89922 RepID=A0ACC2VCZ6_9TREE|nr:hypothetical protein QFC21_005259 [Naganishia friedmannii]